MRWVCIICRCRCSRCWQCRRSCLYLRLPMALSPVLLLLPTRLCCRLLRRVVRVWFHLRHLSALSSAKDNEKHILSFLNTLITTPTTTTTTPSTTAILVAECEDDDTIPTPIRGLFTHTYTTTPPTTDDRQQITLAALADLPPHDGGTASVEADERAEMARVVAGKSAGVSVGELVGVVREGVRLGRRRWIDEEQQRRTAMQT